MKLAGIMVKNIPTVQPKRLMALDLTLSEKRATATNMKHIGIRINTGKNLKDIS